MLLSFSFLCMWLCSRQNGCWWLDLFYSLNLFLGWYTGEEKLANPKRRLNRLHFLRLLHSLQQPTYHHLHNKLNPSVAIISVMKISKLQFILIVLACFVIGLIVGKYVNISPSAVLPLSCKYQGQTYLHGEGFMDACNSCSCQNGQVQCTAMACDTDL